jgi:CO/xanthine dehydrogenase Mo-binding subunit
VDLETDEVKLIKVIAVHDPGRAVNPQQVSGQLQGGMVQDQGWALTENFVTQDGFIQTDRLSAYLIPTLVDVVPDIKLVYVAEPDPVGPFGVRGIGEIGFIPLAPAIVSAVHNALGVWFDRLPLTPECVLRALLSDVGIWPK